MARDSAIEWTGHTFNPWWGCTKVSPACDHCYAETWAKRTGFDVWGADAPRRRLGDDYWNQPLRWDQDAAQSGRRARVFCASMADVFEWDRALDNLRERLWTLIESTPNLDWLLLTKRPHLARRLTPWASAWPTHVWLGTTVENQRFADRRIHFLLDVPCRYRFLSCEPLLGLVNLSAYIDGLRLHWIIAGGESAGRDRPTHPDWIRGPTRPMRERWRRLPFQAVGQLVPAGDLWNRGRQRGNVVHQDEQEERRPYPGRPDVERTPVWLLRPSCSAISARRGRDRVPANS